MSANVAKHASPAAHPAVAPAPVVSELAAGREADWDRYVRGHRDGTFFHLAGWKRLIENILGHRAHYLVSESDGQIDGVLPLVHVKSVLFGNALISTPFLVYGGPLSTSGAASERLLDAARALAHDLGVDYLELRSRFPLDAGWLTKTSYVTFRKALDPDPDANLAAIPRKQRAMIRKGIQAGLQAGFDDTTDRLYRMLLECKRNLGTPFFSPKWLAAIKAEFGPLSEVLTVTSDGRPVSSVMSFRFRDEILPYYGGGGAAARDLKANDFMYWAVMERACRDGVRIFDYGRSMEDTGAYRFKKHWGFEPEPLHYAWHLVRAKELPNLNPSNPRYRFLISAWTRLPLPVAGLVGPHVARRLG